MIGCLDTRRSATFAKIMEHFLVVNFSCEISCGIFCSFSQVLELSIVDFVQYFRSYALHVIELLLSEQRFYEVFNFVKLFLFLFIVLLVLFNVKIS